MPNDRIGKGRLSSEAIVAMQEDFFTRKALEDACDEAQLHDLSRYSPVNC